MSKSEWYYRIAAIVGISLFMVTMLRGEASMSVAAVTTWMVISACHEETLRTIRGQQ